MKQLHAPWRDEYAKNNNPEKNEGTDKTSCPFCFKLSDNKDPHYFILRRFSHNALLLNRYPYNAGHLLIVPFAHVSTLAQLDKVTRAQAMELLSSASQLLTDILKAQGINIGVSMGVAAGAGIPQHVHLHVLPRWIGDTSFLPVLNETKVISFDLTTIYQMLKPDIDALEI